MCSYRDRNGFLLDKNVPVQSSHISFLDQKSSKSYCVISQEPDLYSVKTLSAQAFLASWLDFYGALLSPACILLVGNQGHILCLKNGNGNGTVMPKCYIFETLPGNVTLKIHYTQHNF